MTFIEPPSIITELQERGLRLDVSIDKALGVTEPQIIHPVSFECFSSLKEAMEPDFTRYQKQVLENTRVLAESVAAKGFRIVSGGTDNHLFLVDVGKKGLTGKVCEKALDAAGITVNKNTIPFDPNPPLVTSGLRIGTPAVTTRGMGAAEMKTIAGWIGEVLDAPEDAGIQARIRGKVKELTAAFPLY